MAQVAISINGRPYSVTCEDGQEQRLQDLSTDLDLEVRNLAAAVGQIGDSRLLVIAGLSLIDRLNDLDQEVTDLRGQAKAGDAAEKTRADAAEGRAAAAEAKAANLESQLTEALKRIEALAASLEDA